ncbi:MAG: TatD family hydrolase [Methanomethylovorans sp.]|uniref:TatD family hydrolase n=1 Tax=Methanomethylovorans sp. TaxID=2758717 RepID=UPI000A75D893|nr:TatD family hydrolase [Methanomethylovorans sp.]
MDLQVIDSHCHLDFPKFNKDREETIQRALNAGVEQVLNSGVDPKTNLSTLKLAQKYDHIHATLGCSPHLSPKANNEQIKNMLDFIEDHVTEIAGIGETGLDYHYFTSEAERNRQIEVFKQFIELADRYNKPLVIHGREAEDIALGLSGHLDKVVFHCYSGSLETMRNIVDAGHIISVPTLVCFSEHHQEIAKGVPLEHMLLETDSPYLSPRKGRNEPAFVLDSLPWISKLKGIEQKDIASTTRKNTIKVFGL